MGEVAVGVPIFVTVEEVGDKRSRRGRRERIGRR